MPRERGFTLIELLVSMTLAVILSGLAWTGLVQLKRSSERAAAATDVAMEAGLLYRRFDEDVARTLQQVQMRLETPQLDAGVYGANVRAVRLIGMCELYNRTPGQGTTGWQLADSHLNTAVWYCWEWLPPTLAELAADAQAPGSLWYGRSSPSSRSKDVTIDAIDVNDGSTKSLSVTFKQITQAWRSRKADLGLNDLRLVPGASFAPAVRIVDDRTELLGEDLDRDGVIDPGEDIDGNGVLRPSRLQLVSRRVASCAISWVDYGGWTTTASSAGVAVVDAVGAAVAAGADPWWTGDLRVVDGLYRDARNAGADRGRTVLQARPGLIRFMIELSDRRIGMSRPFRFAIAPDLGVPAATGL
jgi:prepilin-type N-terminal cleavage/methylation domain-containing protein